MPESTNTKSDVKVTLSDKVKVYILFYILIFISFLLIFSIISFFDERIKWEQILELSLGSIVLFPFLIRNSKSEKDKKRQLLLNQVRAIIQDTGIISSHEHIMMNDALADIRFIAVEEAQSKILVGEIVSGTNGKFTSRAFSVDKVLGVRVFEGGKDATDTGNTLGMATIGGLMFGGAGAIVGAISGSAKTNKVSNISLVIAMNDLTTPLISLFFLTHEADKNTVEYKEALSEANKWAAIINILISRREKLRMETQRFEKLLP